VSFLSRIGSALMGSPAPRIIRRPRTVGPAFLEGEQGFYTQLGYRSAIIGRRNGIGGVPGAGFIHERASRTDLVAQSREFYRNNDLYAALVRRLVRYIVGRGFALQAQTADAAWNTDVENRWKRFCRSPEITGRRSMRRVERTLTTELIVCGDAIALKTNRRKLQLFEAEQLRGKGSYQDDGIVRDLAGEPTGFTISPYGLSGDVQIQDAVTYSPDTVIYVGDPERASSSRPVPYAQAAFPMLHRLKDFLDAEVISAQVQSRIALAVTRAGGGLGGTDPDAEFDQEDQDDDDTVKKWVTNIPNASIFHAGAGDKIEGITRTAPSGTFAEGLRAFLRIFFAVVGMPLELGIFDFTGLNYSQFRGAIEVFMGVLEDFQELLEEQFHRPTYAWFLANEIAFNGLQPRPDQDLHAWIKDRFPWVDRLKEAQASGEQVDRGQTTYAAVCKDQNQDYKQVQQQLKRERIDAINISKEVLKETGVEVPYEPFCGLKAPVLTVRTQALDETQPGDDPNAPPPPAPSPPPGKAPMPTPPEAPKKASLEETLQSLADAIADLRARPTKEAA
jgi:capsid protein